VPLLDRVRVGGEPVALDEAQQLWPASVVLEGEYGVSGAALTVPVTLARGEVREVHEWDLTEEQRAAMGAAGEAVRKAAATL
jgi:malate dehydrogenase